MLTEGEKAARRRCSRPVCTPILSLTERPGGRGLLRPHKTTVFQRRGAWRDAPLRGTNDFSLSGNSAEDVFDLQGVIASATGIPYSLRDKKQEGKQPRAAESRQRGEEERFRRRAEENPFTEGDT